MKKRVCIVHRWEGTPNADWYPWLKAQLEKRGFEVNVLAMPNTQTPRIDEWVPFLKRKAGSVDENTFFIGHSVGCQTILRFLETLPKNDKVAGCLFVGGWFNLKPETFVAEGVEEIARPWLDTPIDCEAVNAHTTKIVGLFSDDDPFVPVSDMVLFKERLHARVSLEQKKGHFTNKEEPEVLSAFLELAQ